MTNEDFIKSISLEGEIWKDVVGYEGKYWISSYGRIITNSPIYGLCFLKGEKPNATGHIRVDLYRNSKRKRIYIHRLVALHYIDNPMGYKEIDHIDGNPTNNYYTNLRWCTHAENMRNTNTRYKSCKKSCLYSPLIAKKQGETLCFNSYSEAEKQRFYYNGIIRSIKNGESYRGYKWSYIPDLKSLPINQRTLNQLNANQSLPPKV
jgi:hypothetical protein